MRTEEQHQKGLERLRRQLAAKEQEAIQSEKNAYYDAWDALRAAARLFAWDESDGAEALKKAAAAFGRMGAATKLD